MKTRICILTVSAVAAMSAPVAGAMIPADSRSGHSVARYPLVIKSTVKQTTKAKQATGRYNPQAYVPGGSSQTVAKAIVAQGKRALR